MCVTSVGGGSRAVDQSLPLNFNTSFQFVFHKTLSGALRYRSYAKLLLRNSKNFFRALRGRTFFGLVQYLLFLERTLTGSIIDSIQIDDIVTDIFHQRMLYTLKTSSFVGIVLSKCSLKQRMVSLKIILSMQVVLKVFISNDNL